MAIVSLDDETAFSLKILHHKGLVIAWFCATWSEPGEIMRTGIQKLADAFDDKLQVVRIDVDRFPDLAKRYTVAAVPTLILFKDGKELKRIIGYVSQEELKEYLCTLVR